MNIEKEIIEFLWRSFKLTLDSSASFFYKLCTPFEAQSYIARVAQG